MLNEVKHLFCRIKILRITQDDKKDYHFGGHFYY